jgi:arylsulfatase A
MSGGAVAAEARPNVVLILTDDQGWWDVGINGNPAIETPNMDRLAAQGVYFTRFYASPVCTPTRASLMTGRYFQRTGAIDTYRGLDVMDAREITLAQMFQQAGYRTGIFGKWHLGRYMKYHPCNRGFDEFLGFWQYGFINRYDDSDELFRNREPVVTAGYITDVLTDGAIQFVRANRDRPFFLYLPYNAPHSPYLAPDDLIAKYLKKGLPLPEARVYAMVDRIDSNMGRLLATLDELKLADNTVVLFMSDNGGVSSYFKAGLRGQKGSVWEGGIRSPLMVRWPGKFPAGKRVAAMTQHIDLFPTLCELIGATLPKDRVLDGRSILSLMRAGEGPSPHEYLYHQWCRTRPRADKDWAIHNSQYKLANGELFDLQSDPGEQKNLAADKPEVVRQLRAEFERWFADVTAGRDYAKPPIEVGRADENPVEMDLTWAEAVGKKVEPRYRHYTRDYVANWTEVDDLIRWKMDVTQAGRYEVSISYGCPDGESGSRFRVQAGPSSCEGQVRSTGGEDVYCRPTAVGTLDLTAGPALLEIKPVSIAGRQLMCLHQVWLRRLDG